MQTQIRYIPFLLVIFLLVACTQATPSSQSEATNFPSLRLSTSTISAQQDPFSDLPLESRMATRRGDPRPAAYWAVWNTCAPDNRATQAANNGGQAEGWILLDDLIADPGIQLGDFPLTTCEQGLALLDGKNIEGEDTIDPIYEIAEGLLSAELNLNVGAETCPIAEETVIGGHLVLSGVGFDGTGNYLDIADEYNRAVPRLLELLDAYNSGILCQ